MIPLIIKRPPNLSSFKAWGIVEFRERTDNRFPNHLFSTLSRVLSNLILAITLDTSSTSGEPFWKIWRYHISQMYIIYDNIKQTLYGYEKCKFCIGICLTICYISRTLFAIAMLVPTFIFNPCQC